MSFKANPYRSGLLAGSTGLAILVATPAMGQENTPAEGINVIVVTAEKREKDLQDVPIAITAMSGETLTANGISNVEDLQFFVPGLTVTNDSMAIINIRGIGTSAFGVATDPSTTVHYDGVYISRPTTSYQDMFDVERVEVLRGPQGVLFGRNSAGGTLNIISKMPTDELTGTIGVTLGNLGKRNFSGTISGAVADGARARLTLVKNDRNGVYRDVNFDRRYQDENNLAGRFTLAVDATDRLEIVLRADASRDRETGYPAIRETYPASLVAAGATVPSRPNEIALDAVPRYDIDAWGVSSTIRYDAGPVELKSITAFRSSDVDQTLDVDATDIFLRNIEFSESSKSFTQEFQILSTTPSRLTWILGAFYLREDGEDEIQILEPNRALAIPESNTTNAFALFGQASYEFTDSLRFTTGLRYSYEKKDFGYRIFSNKEEVDSGSPTASWSAWTPKFGVELDLSEDILAYASATRGFKSGGFQLGDAKPFLPEYLWSYEVGLKTTLFDRRLQANFSSFYYDYSNLQVVQYINGVASTTNAGRATIKGVEAEFQAKPTRNLSLTSTISWLDARYDVYFDDQVSLEGNRLPNAPKWNATFGAEYRAPLGSAGFLTLRGDVARRGTAYFKPSNDPRYASSPTTLVNGRISWEPSGGQWEVALYGRNLTDERYATYKTFGTDASGVSNPDLPLTVYGEPRQYGVQLRRFF
ncbi:TonB-dependent receptor [Erythrobacter aureus]|uniref:TonB-dependent receptor n=1 Tax=Erythrobacter aureus TaxID=2182384 RepID=A0A345YFR5_9SPHN|nr:TonB-dependent receptor [Erythrobacter aureus]AXK42767.1 TonB-dependent receptor [Erythrobacter aureus]